MVDDLIASYSCKAMPMPMPMPFSDLIREADFIVGPLHATPFAQGTTSDEMIAVMGATGQVGPAHAG